MSKYAMEDLKEMLCREIDMISERGELDGRDVEMLFKLTTILKNIDKVMPMDEYSRDGGGYSQRRRYSRDGVGYSQGGDWEARGRYEHSYDEGGNSYANRGQHYVRGHYSRDDGKEEMIQKMEKMMNEVSGEQRETIRRAVEELRNA